MYNAESFIYNGTCSDNYNLTIIFFDTPEYHTGLTRETLHTERTLSRSKVRYYGSRYTGGIEFKFSIAKKDAREFSEEESIQINEWLTKNSAPALLHFNSNRSIYVNYYAICTNIEDKIINGRNAKTLTFETDSPFAYSDMQSKKVIVDKELELDLYSHSCEEYYYPKIVIIPDMSTSDITIKNHSDQKSLTLNLTHHPDGIIIDCADCRISDTSGHLIHLDSLGLTVHSESPGSADTAESGALYFPRLLRGRNHLKLTGNCTVEFIMEFPRKAGSI